MTTTRNCFERYVNGVFSSLLSCFASALSCLLVTIGSQTAFWLIPDQKLNRWITPVAMLAALAWGSLGVWWAWVRCPNRNGVTRLVDTLKQSTGFPIPGLRVSAAVAAPIALLLALPIWPVLPLWSALVFGATFFPRYGRQSLYILGGLFISVGATICVFAVSLADVGSHIGIALASLLLLQILLAVVLVVARFRKRFTMLFWLLPVALPFVLSPLEVGSQAKLIVLCGLIIWPGALLAAAELFYRWNVTRARTFLERYEPRHAIGKDVDHEREQLIRRQAQQLWQADWDENRGVRDWEDTLRESDGYCRLHYPEFRHWRATASGETGYITWFRPQVKSVVFRATTLFHNPCLAGGDVIGESAAGLTRDLIPDIGHDQLLRRIREACHSGWNVGRMSPSELVPLVKMPWDHPFTLTLPIDWNGSFVFPQGSGIHDCDGFPCLANPVKVEIHLGRRVLQSVDLLSQTPNSISGPENDVRVRAAELCRCLLWNSWRILPGAYESLLTTVVDVFREVSVALFMEQDEDVKLGQGERFPFASKVDFIERLNFEWANRLPFPLKDLVEVSVLDLHVDTYLAAHVREEIFRLRVLENTLPLRLKSRLDVLRGEVEDILLYDPNSVDRTDNMIDELLVAKTKIEDAAAKSRDLVLRNLANMSDGAPREAFAEISTEVKNSFNQFKNDVQTRFNEISTEVNAVVQTYKERTW